MNNQRINVLYGEQIKVFEKQQECLEQFSKAIDSANKIKRLNSQEENITKIINNFETIQNKSGILREEASDAIELLREEATNTIKSIEDIATDFPFKTFTIIGIISFIGIVTFIGGLALG